MDNFTKRRYEKIAEEYMSILSNSGVIAASEFIVEQRVNDDVWQVVNRVAEDFQWSDSSTYS